MNDFASKEFTVLAPFVVKEADVQDKTNDNVVKVAGYCNWAGKDDNGQTYTDLAGDVVVPSGVDLSVWSGNPQIFWQHDRDKTIGKGLLMEKRPDGLYIEAEIHKDAMDPQDFYRVTSGLVVMFSIGFRTLDCEFRDIEDGEAFFITKSLLLEVSIVSIPANSKSRFSVVKALDGGFTSDTSKRFASEVNETDHDGVLPMKVKLEDGSLVELADLIKEQVGTELDARAEAADLAAKEAAEKAEKEAADLAEKEAAEKADKEAADLAVKEADKEAADLAAKEAAEKAEKETVDTLKSLRDEIAELKTTLAAD